MPIISVLLGYIFFKEDLNKKKVSDLKEIAKELNIPKAEKLLKSDLVYQILDFQSVLPANNTPEPIKQESQQQHRKFRTRNPKKDSPKKEQQQNNTHQTKKREPQKKEDLQPKAENSREKHHPKQHQNPNQKPNPNQIKPTK